MYAALPESLGLCLIGRWLSISKLDRVGRREDQCSLPVLAGSNSAGEGASDRSRRPHSLAMWPNLQSVAAWCVAARSPTALHSSAAYPARPASPYYLTILNLGHEYVISAHNLNMIKNNMMRKQLQINADQCFHFCKFNAQ